MAHINEAIKPGLVISPTKENFPNPIHRVMYLAKIAKDGWSSYRQARNQAEAAEAVMSVEKIDDPSGEILADLTSVRSAIHDNEQATREELYDAGAEDRGQFILTHNLGTPALQEAVLTALDD